MFSMTAMTRYHHLILPRPPYLCETWLQAETSEVGEESRWNASQLNWNYPHSGLEIFLSVLPGDYVLRDAAGGPRGMVRVLIKWKYPFQPAGDDVLGRQRGPMESSGSREEVEMSQRPIAKPRVKVIFNSALIKTMLTGAVYIFYTVLSNRSMKLSNINSSFHSNMSWQQWVKMSLKVNVCTLISFFATDSATWAKGN